MVQRFFRYFWIGLVSYGRSIRFLFLHPTFFYFFLFPVVLFAGLYLGGEELFEEIKTLNLRQQFEHLSYDELDARTDAFPLLIVGLKAILVFISLKLGKYVVLLIMTPILAFISLRVERIITGNTYAFSMKQFLADIERNVRIIGRNMIRQMLFLAGWYLLTLVYSPLDQFTLYFTLLVSSYYYGFSLLDYTNERRRLGVSDSVKFVRQHSGMAYAIGGVFAVLFLVDLSEVIWVKYAALVVGPIVGVIAATIAVHRVVDLRKNKFAKKVPAAQRPDTQW